MARIVDNLNDGWYFTKEQIDPANPPFASMEAVKLPHTWNAFDGQDGGNDFYRGTCWYARILVMAIKEKEVWLEFGGVSQIAVVYINGIEVLRHEAGFSAFRVNMTPYLQDGENRIVVSAANGANQITYPQFVDFTIYGGIYRDVRIITLPKQHFDLDYHGAPGIRVVSILNDDKTATVSVEARVTESAGGDCHIAIMDALGNAVAKCKAVSDGKNTFKAEFILTSPHLWQGVKDPYLYKAAAALWGEDMEALDEISTRFGVRSFSVDPEKGFFLNGELTPIHGVSRHQCREDKGWAISHEDERQDIGLITEMGANAIRLVHYQHSQSFMDLCDAYGMVVWAEIPFISNFIDTPEARLNSHLQMTELIAQSSNHPSICFWGISNEITMGGDDNPGLLANQKELHELCHKMDPTRLTALANLTMVEEDSPQNYLTDVVGYNHYFGWYTGDVEDIGPWFDEFHAARPEVALCLSEYGAEGNINLHSEVPLARDYTEEYQCVYHEWMLKSFCSRPFIWGTFVWNMFEFGSDMRDEGMVSGRNNKGLVNFSRTVKKDAYYLYKAWWTKEPFVHLCGRRFMDRCGKTTTIKAYATGVDEMVLLINGKIVKREKGEHIFTFESVSLPRDSNMVCVVGFLDNAECCRDEMILKRVMVKNPAYSLPDDGNLASVDRVANWFDADYGDKVLVKEGYFSVKDRFDEVMNHPEGEAVVARLLESISKNMDSEGKGPVFSINKGIGKMIGRMTFEDLAKMGGKRFSKDMLQTINGQLQQIKKGSY